MLRKLTNELCLSCKYCRKKNEDGQYCDYLCSTGHSRIFDNNRNMRYDGFLYCDCYEKSTDIEKELKQARTPIPWSVKKIRRDKYGDLPNLWD